MFESEKQQRWWFATHPEYSSSGKGTKKPKRTAENTATDKKVTPEKVDAYVDDALKYVQGPAAELLKSVKRNFGSESDIINQMTYTGHPTSEQERVTSDSLFALNFLLPMIRYAKAPVPVIKAILGNFGRKAVRSAIKGKRTRRPARLPPKGTPERAKIERDRGRGRRVRESQDPTKIKDGSLSRPSRVLARNLEKAGKPRPPNHHPHHTVAAKDSRFPEAKASRKILDEFKIDINNAANGVWLPGKRDVGPGAYHRALHGSEYYKKVYRLLKVAKNREHAIKILEEIGRQLSKNTFFK